ncbi:DMT family transporter [Dinoroseobacter sp. S124A]|uniref:DMT family transporter n=1 Tax=Dinoroseobacter sp. S124A TaxID=3415128 RepID=UPI003C7DA7A3
MSGDSQTRGSEGNRRGGGWLLADMALNIWALSIVKAMGLEVPAAQLVLIRAGVGLILMLPWIWRDRAAFRTLTNLPLHGLRVGLSALALTCSFYAIARVPFALFTAMNFTRPLVLMAMAAMLLAEPIRRSQWVAALVCLCGVAIALQPGTVAYDPALWALAVTILAGTGAVIVTRRLKTAPTVVLMTFYTAGLSLVLAPVAAVQWTPVAPGDWPALLAIGAFAQAAQFCFLRAHKLGEAGMLAILGYLSLVLTTAVGFFVFDEVPTLSLLAGSTLIVAASLWVRLR